MDMHPRATAAVLLLLGVLLAGCSKEADPHVTPSSSVSDTGSPSAGPTSNSTDARVPRDYLLLRIDGNITRDPPEPSTTGGSVCGRTGHPFARVDEANRSLHLVKRGGIPLGGNDFDWAASWLVVWDRLDLDRPSCGSRPALWAAEQPTFSTPLGVYAEEFNFTIEKTQGGLLLDGALLQSGQSVTLHRETTEDGVRTWSDMTFTLHGGWSTAAIHEVDQESDLPDGGGAGVWHSGYPR